MRIMQILKVIKCEIWLSNLSKIYFKTLCNLKKKFTQITDTVFNLKFNFQEPEDILSQWLKGKGTEMPRNQMSAGCE
jgi:hypothetical protein